MKTTVLSTVSLALAAIAFAWNIIHKAPQIGYAETTVLMTEFTEAIQARKQFEEAQKEWDKNLKMLNDSLMSGVARMKAGYDKASKAQQDSMRTGLQKRNDDLQRYTNAVKQKSEEKERELMDPVVKKINSFLDLWGKQHGYDIIFGTMQGGNVLQANQRMNVTAMVLKDLNDHYKDLPAAKPDTDTSKAAPGEKKP
jgi:outer membrane protein